jgi:hypothetical protein
MAVFFGIYMKLLFDHIHGFGKMAKEAILYYPCAAIFEPHEYNMALETGWFPLNKHIWFQSRSTRIQLDKYKTRKSIYKKVKNVTWHLWKPDKKLLGPIYEKYAAHRQYNTNNLTLDDICDNSNQILLYRRNGKFIGFLAFKIINKAFLSVEFAWDYEEPELSLGHVSRHVESVLAKQRGCEYIYMSSGYETCSLYKSDYAGFQWWKGYEWSEDVDMYRQMCYNDSAVEIKNYFNRLEEK